MERSREEVDLADWYGNSWAKSQKFFFVAVWLVLLWEALLGCCITFSQLEWMSLCMGRFLRVGAMGNGVRSEIIEVKEADDDFVSHGKNVAYNGGETATGRRFYTEKWHNPNYIRKKICSLQKKGYRRAKAWAWREVRRLLSQSQQKINDGWAKTVTAEEVKKWLDSAYIVKKVVLNMQIEWMKKEESGVHPRCGWSNCRCCNVPDVHGRLNEM